MTKHRFRIIVPLIAASLLAAACGSSDDDPSAEPSDSEVPAETTASTDGDDVTTSEAPQATDATDGPSEGPAELRVALVLLGVKEEPWYSTMIESLDRAAEAQPHGLEISYEVLENVDYAAGEPVARDLSASGNYDMIIMHSTYSEAVAAVQDEFPDILYAFSGAGNEPTGKNGYWLNVYTHEPAYLSGIIAGMMTETNKLGAVAAFPFPVVNSPLHSWIEGATSVNSGVEADVTYLESWFDPAKAREAAEAQVAAGADMLYAERFGPFEAALANEGVYAFGHFSNQNAVAPEVVLSSAEARWDPGLATLIDAWYEHMANGVPYDAPMEPLMYLMAEGGAEIVVSDLVPAEVADAVNDARDKIMSGELVIEFNDAPIES